MASKDYCCGRLKRVIAQGDRVHETKQFGDVRVGGAERYVVSYISDQNVILRAFRIKDNSFISECHYTRKQFDEKFELCPGV